MRPGSLYRAVTGRYTYVDIGLEGLTPAEAAAHVAEVRLAMAAQGLLVDGERSLPVPAQPAPVADEPDRAITSYTGTTADATIPPHTISGVGGSVATRNDTVLTPHQQELRAADAAAAAKGVPLPTIPGPPQRDTALQSAPAISWSQQPPSAKPSVKDPEAPSTELQRGKIRAMARKGENHRLLAEWLKSNDYLSIDALTKGDASALIDHLVAQG